MVTADKKRGIRQYYWAHDGKHLLYMQDNDGDENFHVYGVDLDDRQDPRPHAVRGRPRRSRRDLDHEAPRRRCSSALNKRDKQALRHLPHRPLDRRR